MKEYKKKQKEKSDYLQMVKENSPKSNHAKNLLLAFLVGGTICTLGQFIMNIGLNTLDMPIQDAANFTTITMIFIGALLTAIGVYDDIGKFAGAGSVVPITGFANSVVSPAIEYKSEGFILGVGAKIFTLAGPVLVYGITSSVVIGILHLIFGD